MASIKSVLLDGSGKTLSSGSSDIIKSFIEGFVLFTKALEL